MKKPISILLVEDAPDDVLITRHFLSDCFEHGNSREDCLRSAIIARHSGKVEVESQSGQGAAFTVWLPVFRQPGGG